jgi:hypothetical protein
MTITTELANHLEQLAAIPGSPEQVGWIAENFVCGFILAFSGAFERFREVAGNQEAVKAEFRSIVAVCRGSEVAKLLLPRIAARYAGPHVGGKRTIAIDLDAAWGPVGPDDQLILTNRTGTDLHNCTVLVELHGQDGDVARNVYFVPRWQVGTPIYARCNPGTEILGETIGRRTVPLVESIVTSVWSDELTRESIT